MLYRFLPLIPKSGAWSLDHWAVCKKKQPQLQSQTKSFHSKPSYWGKQWPSWKDRRLPLWKCRIQTIFANPSQVPWAPGSYAFLLLLPSKAGSFSTPQVPELLAWALHPQPAQLLRCPKVLLFFSNLGQQLHCIE